MSIINKKPTILEFLEQLYAVSSDDFSELKSIINNEDEPYIKRTLVSSMPQQKISYVSDAGIHKVELTLDKISGRAYKGYLVYEDLGHDEYLCFFISFDAKKDKELSLYTIDVEKETYEFIQENLSIEELRRTLGEHAGPSGGGGSDDYNDLKNKPQINGINVRGNQSLIDYDLANEIASGDNEVVVDLDDTETQLLISLHAKRVTISAPESAMSGSITAEQLAALKESTMSYIMLNNEKYYLNDDGHVVGSIGYTHIGVENGVFMKKNITITESTLTWVLTVVEDKSGDPVFIINGSIDIVDPMLEAPITFSSDNPFNDISRFMTDNNRLPIVVLNLDLVHRGSVAMTITTTLNLVSDNRRTSGELSFSVGLIATNSTSSGDVNDIIIHLTAGRMQGNMTIAHLGQDNTILIIGSISASRDITVTTRINFSSSNPYEDIVAYRDEKGVLPPIVAKIDEVDDVSGDIMISRYYIMNSNDASGNNFMLNGSKVNYNDSDARLTFDRLEIAVSDFDFRGFYTTKTIEIEPSAEQFDIRLQLNPDLSNITVSSENHYENITRYLKENQKFPDMMVSIFVGKTDITATKATRIEYSSSEAIVYAYYNSGTHGTIRSERIKITMQSSGLQTDQQAERDLDEIHALGSEVIEVHSAADLPTAAVTDGLVHIVMCDNGLLPDPADQLTGYIYFEKEA